MTNLRYIPGVVSLEFKSDACVGCGLCTQVCPRGVFVLENGKASVKDIDACSECAACVTNCVRGAIRLRPARGTTASVIHDWLRRAGLRKAGSWQDQLHSK